MNEQNLSYLKDALKYMGFGESLHEALQKNISEEKAEFTLSLQTEIARKPFGATLHFRKGDTTDTYFFNKWDASLKTDAGTAGQTFYVNRGHGVTLKEGFNLLEGRSVHKELTGKEGNKYAAWLTLDRSVMDKTGNYKLQQYHSNYGYDLEKVLAAFPIRELAQPDQKDALLRSLRRGNQQAVTFEKNGFAEKLLVEAAPRFKSLNVYDHNGERISMDELQRRFDVVPLKAKTEELTVVGRAAGRTEGQVVPPKGEGPSMVAEPAPAKSKGVAPLKEEKELLPKKRTATGRGLHP